VAIAVMVPSGREVEVETTSWDDSTVAGRPVTYEGDRIIFNPQSMLPEKPYTFKFLGYWWSVVKHLDESMDFYYAPLSRPGGR